MRKAWILSLAAVLLCACGARGEDVQPKDVFDAYRKAILEAKGPEALELLAKQTIDYYQRALDHALKSDEATVKGLMLLDRLLIFQVRARIGHEELKKMDGKALLSYSIKNGWIGRDSVERLTDCTVRDGANENEKDLVVDANGRKVMMFKFYKEDGKWKLDLMANAAMVNLLFKHMAKEAEMEEDDFALSVLEGLAGRKVTAKEVYTPVVGGAAAGAEGDTPAKLGKRYLDALLAGDLARYKACWLDAQRALKMAAAMESAGKAKPSAEDLKKMEEYLQKREAAVEAAFPALRKVLTDNIKDLDKVTFTGVDAAVHTKMGMEGFNEIDIQFLSADGKTGYRLRVDDGRKVDGVWYMTDKPFLELDVLSDPSKPDTGVRTITPKPGAAPAE
ncbi:MAG: hypothetical protein L6R28_20025 [Planctomycetes bacterium]|nr:hypothetical protein [Planctomycetota bacterium]